MALYFDVVVRAVDLEYPRSIALGMMVMMLGVRVGAA